MHKLREALRKKTCLHFIDTLMNAQSKLEQSIQSLRDTDFERSEEGFDNGKAEAVWITEGIRERLIELRNQLHQLNKKIAPGDCLVVDFFDLDTTTNELTIRDSAEIKVGESEGLGVFFVGEECFTLIPLNVPECPYSYAMVSEIRTDETPDCVTQGSLVGIESDGEVEWYYLTEIGRASCRERVYVLV